MSTSSASDFAFILRMTWPRWIFTVISVTPISPAICLFMSPVVTKRHDLLLARGQLFEQPLELLQALGFLAPFPVALERDGDGVEQILIAERLDQEIDGPGFHRPHRHRHVAVPGDEDDRYVDIRLGELGLKVEPAALRQPDIEHKTARHIGQLGLQQLRSRPEQLDAQTHRAQQAAQRFAQRRIVVDDNDHGLLRGRCIARWRAAVHDAATNGTVNWKVTPAPSLQEAHSRPPCPSTIERQIERPIPIPSALVVKKALNTRSS